MIYGLPRTLNYAVLEQPSLGWQGLIVGPYTCYKRINKDQLV